MEYSPIDLKVLWLAMNIKSDCFFHLTDYYGDVESIWDNFDKSDTKLGFINDKIKSALDKTRDLSYVNNCIEKWKYPKFMTIMSDNYPKLLGEIAALPLVLFYKGNVNSFDRFVCVVGSRKCTSYGIECATDIGYGLASNGVCVVSGGARGIDSAAHKGALKAKGNTIVVLGCGIDVVYPPENEQLFEQVVDCGGGIITECLPGESPNPWNFPARNRIISGMSSGVVVVEAGKKSGALITADMAASEGRDVFCVPGSIKSAQSIGTNELIKNGAVLITSYEDVLNEYNWVKKVGNKKTIDIFENLDNTEKTVVQAIVNKGTITMDDLCVATSMDIGTLNSIITMLEISGVIKRLPGNILTI